MDILYTIMFMLYALMMWCGYIYLNRRVEMLEAEKVHVRKRLDELELAVGVLETRMAPDIAQTDSTVYNTIPPYTQTLSTDDE